MIAVILAAAVAHCAPLRPEGLAELAKARGGQVKLVFFSSWCVACKGSLEAAQTDKDAVVVGSFDKRERLEEIIGALQIKAPCFVDEGVTERLGVSSLPASVVWKL